MKRGERRRRKEGVDEDLRLALSRQDMDQYELDAIMNGNDI